MRMFYHCLTVLLSSQRVRFTHHSLQTVLLMCEQASCKQPRLRSTTRAALCTGQGGRNCHIIKVSCLSKTGRPDMGRMASCREKDVA